MAPKIRNIIIFVAIAGAFLLIYLFFINSSTSEDALVSSNTSLPGVNDSGSGVANSGPSVAAGDFLTLLLSVKGIKLDDVLLSDQAFNSLHDSSIILTPDGNEGRPNPFAQFGNDSTSFTTLNTTNTTTETTPASTPPANPTTTPTTATTPAATTTTTNPATTPAL